MKTKNKKNTVKPLSAKKMQKLMDEIRPLEKKRNKKGLTKSEEKVYTKLNSELTGLPKKFFTKNFNDKLTDVITKTDKMIKLLEKQSK